MTALSIDGGDERTGLSGEINDEENTDVSAKRKDDEWLDCSCEGCNNEFEHDEAAIVSRSDSRRFFFV